MLVTIDSWIVHGLLKDVRKVLSRPTWESWWDTLSTIIINIKYLYFWFRVPLIHSTDSNVSVIYRFHLKSVSVTLKSRWVTWCSILQVTSVLWLIHEGRNKKYTSCDVNGLVLDNDGGSWPMDL